LSPQENNQPWCEASDQFLNEAAFAAGAADFISAHSYFQSDGTGYWQMQNETGGWYYRKAQRKFPNKTLMLTEYSCNSANVPDAQKGTMYAKYLRDLVGVKAAFSFCLSWANDSHNEAWVRGQVTDIPKSLGALL
jgi:hypothetical protein